MYDYDGASESDKPSEDELDDMCRELGIPLVEAGEAQVPLIGGEEEGGEGMLQKEEGGGDDEEGGDDDDDDDDDDDGDDGDDGDEGKGRIKGKRDMRGSMSDNDSGDDEDDAPKEDEDDVSDADDEDGSGDAQVVSAAVWEEPAGGGASEGWVPLNATGGRKKGSDVLAKGDIVTYKARDGTLVTTEVKSVDLSIDPPSYGVMINGTYRETVRDRLIFMERPLTQTHRTAAANSSGSAVPTGWIDPSERFLDVSRGWVHPSLAGVGGGFASSMRKGKGADRRGDGSSMTDSSSSDGDFAQAGGGDERFSKDAFDMIAGAARRHRHAEEVRLDSTSQFLIFCKKESTVTRGTPRR
jgi:hypothetical protein